MRLMITVGSNVINELPSEMQKHVLRRINAINRSGLLLSHHLDWLDDARRSGLLKNLSRNEQNEFLDTVYHVAENTGGIVGKQLGETARHMYPSLKKSMM